MAQKSAGLLMYRKRGKTPELLLVHPGGPFWVKRDDYAWTIPKGLFEVGEDPLSAAIREFEEETGCQPSGEFIQLGHFKQPSGKIISAWAVEGNFDLANFKSNLFSLEWPPRSGCIQDYPEVDRAAWFSSNDALRKIIKGQRPIIVCLLQSLGLAP
jgi:predicted NUDIX family NTP pyrophosphohydrolase